MVPTSGEDRAAWRSVAIDDTVPAMGTGTEFLAASVAAPLAASLHLEAAPFGVSGLPSVPHLAIDQTTRS
jgi:hypothetical protein